MKLNLWTRLRYDITRYCKAWENRRESPANRAFLIRYPLTLASVIWMTAALILPRLWFWGFIMASAILLAVAIVLTTLWHQQRRFQHRDAGKHQMRVAFTYYAAFYFAVVPITFLLSFTSLSLSWRSALAVWGSLVLCGMYFVILNRKTWVLEFKPIEVWQYWPGGARDEEMRFLNTPRARFKEREIQDIIELGIPKDLLELYINYNNPPSMDKFLVRVLVQKKHDGSVKELTEHLSNMLAQFNTIPDPNLAFDELLKNYDDARRQLQQQANRALAITNQNEGASSSLARGATLSANGTAQSQASVTDGQFAKLMRFFETAHSHKSRSVPLVPISPLDRVKFAWNKADYISCTMLIENIMTQDRSTFNLELTPIAIFSPDDVGMPNMFRAFIDKDMATLKQNRLNVMQTLIKNFAVEFFRAKRFVEAVSNEGLTAFKEQLIDRFANHTIEWGQGLQLMSWSIVPRPILDQRIIDSYYDRLVTENRIAGRYSKIDVLKEKLDTNDLNDIVRILIASDARSVPKVSGEIFRNKQASPEPAAMQSAEVIQVQDAKPLTTPLPFDQGVAATSQQTAPLPPDIDVAAVRVAVSQPTPPLPPDIDVPATWIATSQPMPPLPPGIDVPPARVVTSQPMPPLPPDIDVTEAQESDKARQTAILSKPKSDSLREKSPKRAEPVTEEPQPDVTEQATVDAAAVAEDDETVPDENYAKRVARLRMPVEPEKPEKRDKSSKQ
jgi:hypothetical protein